VPIVLKYGSLILLEPSGPFQTCNGIVLLYPSQRQIRLCEIWGSRACHWAACRLVGTYCILLVKDVRVHVWWWWQQQVPLKHFYVSLRLRSATSELYILQITILIVNLDDAIPLCMCNKFHCKVPSYATIEYQL
jgi:hypothetical protein